MNGERVRSSRMSVSSCLCYFYFKHTHVLRDKLCKEGVFLHR